MDTYEAIASKLDIREFAAKVVPDQTKRKILEAARLTGSSMNSQHWRFILVQDKRGLKRLAADSFSGGWVEGSDFAVVILTNPKIPGSVIDAGRVLQDMQLAAWNFGVVSSLYTGINDEGIRKDLGIPEDLKPSAVLGFGYPENKVHGKNKKRKPIDELVFSERYGSKLELK